MLLLSLTVWFGVLLSGSSLWNLTRKALSLLCLTPELGRLRELGAGKRGCSDASLWSLQVDGFGKTIIMTWWCMAPKMCEEREVEIEKNR